MLLGDSKKQGNSVNNWASEQVQGRSLEMGVCGMQEASVPPLSGGSGQARPLESCGGGLAGCALQKVLEQLSPALP